MPPTKTLRGSSGIVADGVRRGLAGGGELESALGFGNRGTARVGFYCFGLLRRLGFMWGRRQRAVLERDSDWAGLIGPSCWSSFGLSQNDSI
jgi:hypothetical protein